jgi:fumarylacetoacetate (FAA) hydrolase
MKLATLKDGTPDGALVVVSHDLIRAASAQRIAPTMQRALEQWHEKEGELRTLSDDLEAGRLANAFEFLAKDAAAPLPRAYQWCDGSAFLNHGRLMEKAFNTSPIPDLDSIPLMYQGGSDDFLGASDDVPLPDESGGIDFEGEFGVIVGDVPMGAAAESAEAQIRLLVQLNDWSLRAYGPREMKSGFGFFQAKPSTSFAPVAITPDELDREWIDGRIHLNLHVDWNDAWFGKPNGREMNFSFYELIAHAAKTRRLRAGTILGSGTVSNVDRSVGSACISERRVIEILETGSAKTGFMKFGDRVRMQARSTAGNAPFGTIDQRVIKQ